MQLQEEYNKHEYKSFSNGIEILVKPFYADELSKPYMNRHIFVYKIKIKNNSTNKVQLLRRKWKIVENDGTNYSIEGEGVIGKQPVIESNEEFEYASQAILYADSGIMYGTYSFINLDTNNVMEVEIPAFSLDTYLDDK